MPASFKPLIHAWCHSAIDGHLQKSLNRTGDSSCSLLVLGACAGRLLMSVVASFVSVVPIVSKRVGSLWDLQALALHESAPINPLVSPPGTRIGTTGLGTTEADLPAQRLTPPPMNEIFHDLIYRSICQMPFAESETAADSF